MSDIILDFADWIVFEVIKLERGSQIAEAADFFVYDSIKILILLFVMIFAMGFLRTYITQERIHRMLTGKGYGIGNFMASLFGAVTPFCSCSSIPIFMGFIQAGVPLGIASSFLITSPLVNEYIAVLMWGFFGWKITLAYVAAGILLGTVLGIIIGRTGMEKYLETDVIGKKQKEGKYERFSDRLRFGFNEAKTVMAKLWLWIIVGVGVGAIAHGFVPDDLVQSVISSTGALSVPLAVLVGIPLYANCAAIVPLVVVLFDKGVPLGTALAFLMATAGLSLPEAIMLRRVMKLKLLLVFFGMVGLGIIIIGYFFNLIF